MAAFGLAGCNGDYDDWASPQAYGPEEAAAAYGVTFSNGPEATAVMPDEDGVIQLVEIKTSNSGVAGYTLKGLTVNGEEIEGTVSGNYITVDAATLAKFIEKQNNSRAAVARPLEVKSLVSINLENGDAFTAEGATTTGSFTPAPTPAIDSKGYFLLGDFENVGWNLPTPLWMEDNGDGTFTAKVTTVNDGSNWFKFYAGSLYDNADWDKVNSGQMGCAENGDATTPNFLVYTNDPLYTGGVQTPTIEGKGTFNITLDMKNLTYTITRAESKYYIVGNLQGWSQTDMSCMFYAQGGNSYSYTTKWNGAWDLKIWEGGDFGNWDKAFGTAVDGATDASGSLVNKDAQSFAAPSQNEFWTLTVDMNSLSYSWTKLGNQAPATYSAVSIIGDFNGWKTDNNSEIDMTQRPSAPHNWYVRATIPSAGGLKFRANHDWATSWGSTKDYAVGDVYYGPTGTENITVPAGTYEFYLNDITGQWNIVAVN